jgi:hypothetical protein
VPSGGTEDEGELVIGLPDIGPVDTQPGDVHPATVDARRPQSDLVYRAPGTPRYRRPLRGR